MDETCAPEILYGRAREAVDGMLTLRASKVVVSEASLHSVKSSAFAIQLQLDPRFLHLQ